MSTCDPRVYSRVTPILFNGLQSRLQTMGIALTGNTGRVEGPMGIVLEYAFEPNGQTLQIHVVEKSFIVPCSQIHNMIEKAMQELGWQGTESKV